MAERERVMSKRENDEKKGTFRSGFVAIIGRPNAGKSTLMNRLVGQKIAIVTSKPQTTRNRIQGIVTKPQGQIVFIDTPGLHEANSALGRQMMHEVAAAIEGIDVLLLMVDASRVSDQTDSMLIEKAQRFPGKTILVLNKVDAVPKQNLLPLIDRFRALGYDDWVSLELPNPTLWQAKAAQIAEMGLTAVNRILGR